MKSVFINIASTSSRLLYSISQQKLRSLTLLTLLVCVFTVLAQAQTPPKPKSSSSPPAEAGPATSPSLPPATNTLPIPVNELPPLELPDLPGTAPKAPGSEATIDIPAPLPPLPMPKGPAVVKADIKPTGQRYFKLFYNGQWIGWSKFRVTGEMALGDTDALIISSIGEVRVGFGQVSPSQFESRLMLDRKSLRPNYYKCVQVAPGGSFEVECVYSDSMVAQTNRTGDSRTVNFHDYPKGEPPQLVFNNLWGHLDTFPEHYWIMVRSAINGGTVPSYDPILRGEGSVTVYEPTTEDYALGGRTIKTKVYPISDLRGTLQARVRIASDSLELLEVEEIGSGLKIIRTDASVEKNLSGLKGVDLSQIQIAPSNIVFPDPEQLTALEAEVDIRLRGGQLADHRIAGYRQYFTGELSEGLMKGKVFVRSVPRDIPFDSPYPLEKKHVESEILPYLTSGAGAEVDYPPLAIKAREIAWKSPSAFEAAKRLTNFVTDIEEGVSLPSARYALDSGVGNPESKALLLVAMCRAVGLPARKISGIAFRDGDFVPHHWVEVWLSKNLQWVPFDPSTGEAGRVSASHIALLDSGDIQNIKIRVTNYAPRATKKVAYIARELQWLPGEKRIYGVYKDGKKIGTETAAVGDIEIINNEELYQFSASAEIYTPGGLQVTAVKEYLNPQGLPKQIVLSHKDAAQENSTSYEFSEDTVLIKSGKPGDEAYEKESGREFPFAKGTYFIDPRLLSQWALLAGQISLELGAEKEYSLSTFSPDKKVSKKVLLEVDEAELIELKPTLAIPEKEEAKATVKAEATPESAGLKESTQEASASDGATKEEVDKELSSSPVNDQDENSVAKPDADIKAPAAGDDALVPSLEEKQEEAASKPLSLKDALNALADDKPGTVKTIRLSTDSGIDLWINARHQIVKIEIPDKGIELILEKSESL